MKPFLSTSLHQSLLNFNCKLGNKFLKQRKGKQETQLFWKIFSYFKIILKKLFFFFNQVGNSAEAVSAFNMNKVS